jgi:hypothetical protein
VLLTEALKLVFASVALRNSHANILEEATTGICSLVHTFADFLRIHLYVLRLPVRPAARARNVMASSLANVESSRNAEGR